MSEILHTQVSANNIQSKKQYNFIAKVSLYAGLLFAFIFIVSFLLSKYWLIESYEATNVFAIIGSVFLIINIFLSFFIGMKGTKNSIGLIIFYITFFCLTFIIIFSCYFSLLGNEIMFYSLAFTSLAMITTSVIGFMIKPKTAYSLMKISTISIGAYFMISLCGSLIIWFLSPVTIEIWQIIVTALIGVVIICSNIYTFYSLKKMSEFMEIESLDKKDNLKLTLFQTLSLLSSVINTFILMLRVLSIIRK